MVAPRHLETKAEKFTRLSQKRMEQVEHFVRLINQLASPNYRHDPDQAMAVIKNLDSIVRNAAATYGVTYHTLIVDPKAPPKVMGSIDEVDIAKAIDMIQKDQLHAAVTLLKKALSQAPR